MDKLENNIVYNYEQWPEIFGISESEVLEIMAAHQEHEHKGSFSDWCRMYSGIHRESPYEQSLSGWLACYRWMKAKEAAK